MRALRLLLGLWFAGLVCSLSASAQAVNEFAIPSGSVARRLTSAPDAVWFTEGNAIGRIDLRGRVIEFPLPPGRSPQGIAFGPDGALWFTESSRRIGRLTTDGLLTEYTVPSTGLATIVVGPDASLWYTAFFSFVVGKITTAGVATEYPTPVTPISPDQIAPGPDGALWFTLYSDSRVGRITTSGQVTMLPLPSGAVARAIAKGSDGQLWLAPESAAIGRLTVSGAYSEIPIPSGGSAAGEGTLATSAVGDVWFSESVAKRIGRILRNGGLEEFPLPSLAGFPQAITVGPDGAVWFAEFGQPIIGRFGFGAVPPSDIPTLSREALLGLALALALVAITLLRKS
ncbi:MAG: Virginiamycin B lyase [Acidobacteriota bacterium]|nr:Virginiamycin B lyase [Acidobacteriota bacterium]